jgi:hypothetical protein
MDIKKEGSLLFIIPYLLLEPEYLWLSFFAWKLPLSIDISA